MKSKIIIFIILVLNFNAFGQTVDFTKTIAIDTIVRSFSISTADTAIFQTGRYLAFPSITKVGSRICLVYKNGTGHILDATAFIGFIYSDDDGETWSIEDTLSHTVRAGANWQNAWISEQKGRLICFISDYNGDVDALSWVRVSDDQGITWSDTVRISSDFGSVFITPHSRVLEIDTGFIMAAWAGNSGLTFKLTVFQFSSDTGRTWIDYSELDQLITTSEPSIIFNKKGAMLLRTSNLQQNYTSLDTAQNFYVTSNLGYAIANPVYFVKGENIYL